MDEQWTIRGLARELGVEWGWVYNRIRNGFLIHAAANFASFLVFRGLSINESTLWRRD
jgi:hypothetical protein